jgi:nascent polypeptide-associated complex subunit alpha
MGQETYQVVGEAHIREKSTEPDINADDIKTVMEQANCDENKAKEALKEAKGDIAQAILALQD